MEQWLPRGTTVKAEKIRDILPKIHTLKPNRIEAELLSGVKIENEKEDPLSGPLFDWVCLADASAATTATAAVSA